MRAVLKLTTLLLTLGSLSTHAASHTMDSSFHVVSYDIAGTVFDFYRSEERRISVTKDCLKGAEFSCEAIDLLKSLQKPDLHLPPGGVNPGSFLCEQFHGQVLIGLTPEKDEQSFCQMKDHSMISCGTLAYFYVVLPAEGKP